MIGGRSHFGSGSGWRLWGFEGQGLRGRLGGLERCGFGVGVGEWGIG